MLHLIPRTLPRLSVMLPHLGGVESIAQALAVAPRTVYRWQAADDCPRPVALALFWVTPWGWSEVQAEAAQRVQTAEGLAQALGRENAALAARVARLEALGGFGSANAPAFDAWPLRAFALSWSALPG